MPGTLNTRTPGSGCLCAEPGPRREPCPVPSSFAHELQERGIVLLQWEPLPSLAALADEFVGSDAVRREAALFEQGERGTMKPWLVKYGDQCKVAPGSPLYEAGLELMPLVELAIGPCRFICADIWYSLPGAESRGRKWSQNWHRDPEGETVVKAMLFLRDVDDESGPFEFIDGSHKSHFDACLPKSYLTQEGAGRLCGVEVSRCCVPAGTCVIANTAGIHRGGSTRSKSRLCCVWTYVLADNPMPAKFSIN